MFGNKDILLRYVGRDRLQTDRLYGGGIREDLRAGYQNGFIPLGPHLNVIFGIGLHRLLGL